MSTTTAPYVVGSATSEAAARRIEEHLPKKRERVLRALRLYGPLTDNEGIDITGMRNGWRGRRGELEADGLVVRTGVTRNGSDLWRVTTATERMELLQRKALQEEEERSAKLDRVQWLEEALARALNLLPQCACDGPGCGVCFATRALKGER